MWESSPNNFCPDVPQQFISVIIISFMNDALVYKVLLTLPPRILVLAHILLVARAGRSRFCLGEERRSRAAKEEDPAQMKEAMLMQWDTGCHSPPVLYTRTEKSQHLLRNLWLYRDIYI